MEHKITVKLFSIDRGLRTMEHQKLVRIKSKDHNLLIMEDHMPVMGELDGSLEVVGEDTQEILEHVQGVYMHSDNTFEFLEKQKA